MEVTYKPVVIKTIKVSRLGVGSAVQCRGAARRGSTHASSISESPSPFAATLTSRSSFGPRCCVFAVCVRAQWAIPVSSINMVAQVNAKDGLAVMRLTFDADEARKQWDVHHRSKEKGELRGDKKHEFQFRSATERQRFVNSIEAVFWQTARKRLNISTVDK